MVKTLKKAQEGFAHLLIIGLVVVVAVGAVGAYVISTSNAQGGYTPRWADCYLNGIKFTITQSNRTGHATVVSKGKAVKYYVIELDKFAKKSYYNNKNTLNFKYPQIHHNESVWRKATFSAYCPNAHDPNTNSHWKTEVRGQWQTRS